MTYTLIKDQEQVELERRRNNLHCFAKHLWITKDIVGHIFPFLECHQCNDMTFCRKVKKLIEEHFSG